MSDRDLASAHNDPAPQGKRTPGVVSEEPRPLSVSEERLYDLLHATLLRDVTKWLEERRTRRRYTIVATFCIVAIFAVVNGAFFMDQLVRDYVEEATSTISSEFDSLAASVLFQSQIASLNSRAVSLQESGGFSQDDADQLIGLVARLYASGVDNEDVALDERLENFGSMTFAIESIAASFAGADRGDLVTDIIDAAPEVTAQSDVVTQILVQMTGRDLIGTAGGASTWSDPGGTEASLYEDYRAYVQRARETGFPELYLVFELVVRNMEGRDDEEILELIAEIADLNDLDQDNFVSVMRSLALDESTATNRRAAARTRSFLMTYGTADPRLELVVNALERGVENEIPENVREVALGEVGRYQFASRGMEEWYSVVILEAARYQIDVVSQEGDPFVSIWSRDDLSEPLAVDDDGGVGTDARIAIDLDPETYYLTIGELSAGRGDFSLWIRRIDR